VSKFTEIVLNICRLVTMATVTVWVL